MRVDACRRGLLPGFGISRVGCGLALAAEGGAEGDHSEEWGGWGNRLVATRERITGDTKV